MELKQLQYFRRAAKRQSISQAAEELYITQSAISRCIQKLEQEVGAQLLIRKSNGVVPTNAGSALLEELDAVFLHLERGLSNARMTANQSSPGLSVVYSFEDFDLKLLETFHGNFPDVQTRLDILPPDQAFRELLAGKADFAIIPKLDDHVGIVFDHLLTEEVMLSPAPGNPLYGRERIAVSELDGLSCTCNEVSVCWQEIQRSCLENDINITLQLSSSSHEAAGRFQILTNSIIFIPISVVFQDRPVTDTRQLVPPARIIPNVFRRSIYIAYSKDKHMNPAERHFLGLVKGYYRKMDSTLLKLFP